MDSFDYLCLNYRLFEGYCKQMLLSSKTEQEKTWYASRLKLTQSQIREIKALESNFRKNEFLTQELSSHEEENLRKFDEMILENPELKKRLNLDLN